MKRSADVAELDVHKKETECPICNIEYHVNAFINFRGCCMKRICDVCPFCRTPELEEDEKWVSIRRHAEKDHPLAITHLGDCYEAGLHGLVPSREEAARLFQRAADLGDVLAMFSLGVAYEHGRGVKLDKKKAVEYYRMAADRGYANAQFNLGICFENGKGVAQDDAEALRLFKLAADQGLAEAEYGLGVMFENGFGVTRDDGEAIRWYAQAADRGDKDAKAKIAGLIGDPDIAEVAGPLARAAAKGNKKAKAALAVLLLDTVS